MKAKNTRQQICEAGEKLFAQKGYSAVGIKVILDEVGIPKGSFYHYFKSKDEFAAAVAQNYFEKQYAGLDEQLQQQNDDVIGTIIHFLDGVLRAMTMDDGCTQGCVLANLTIDSNEQTPVLQHTLKQLHQQWVDYMSAFISQVSTNDKILVGNSEQRAQLCWALWEGCVLMHKASGDLERASRTLTLGLNSLLRGV